MNNLKFYAITYFVKYIQNYGSAINYDTAHSEAAYKNLHQVFYGQTNKKEYKLQILKHNIYHTNVIAIQDTIIIPKVLNGSAKQISLLLTYLIRSYVGMQYNKSVAKI